MKILKYGNTYTYYINGLLIDTDMPGTLSAFYRELKRNGLTLSDIRYVIATHYHPDHIGLIGELMKKGVQLLIAEHQLPHVHFSDNIFARTKNISYTPIREQDALVFSCDDSRRFLADTGIDGMIIPTFSHSPEGIALLTDDGSCFAGDLEPMSNIGAYDDNPALSDDWKRISEYKPKKIYYGHFLTQS